MQKLPGPLAGPANHSTGGASRAGPPREDAGVGRWRRAPPSQGSGAGYAAVAAYSPAAQRALRLHHRPNPGENTVQNQPGVQPDQIDVNDAQALAHWAKKLDTTEEQLRDAVAEVGSKAADVEMHLKGARSTTNSDRVKELGG
ncbi:DUF3606 domain-containing protein [Ramlibacter terrae]|uniref:DUF3606 domain-containing protein n=1 Tax=Ramlibacter terrae TaxID=2732511 RepID=A0ABX6P707_9BURK|nr:DUF3606 domain-containing protein [Ramlibacter terrae]